MEKDVRVFFGLKKGRSFNGTASTLESEKSGKWTVTNQKLEKLVGLVPFFK